jgi:hypothetical protein
MNYKKMKTEDLVQEYFRQFVNDSRLPDLFALIPERDLRQWLIDQLENY